VEAFFRVALANRRDDVLVGVVDRLRCTKVAEVVLVIWPSGGDHLCATLGRELHCVATNATSSSNDEYTITLGGIESVDTHKRGNTRHGKGSRLQEVEARRLGDDEHVLGAGNVVGPGALVEHRRAEESEDLVSYLVAAHLRSYLLDYARKVAAYGHRELVLHHSLQHAGGDGNVEGVDRGGVHTNKYLVGGNLWA
jgi:hypothetical protein